MSTGGVLAGRLAARFGVGRTIPMAIALSGVGALAYPLAPPSTADVLIVAGGLLRS